MKFSKLVVILFIIFFLSLPYLETETFGTVLPVSEFNIAMVKPTFTAAAYSDNAFYDYYDKHHDVRDGKNVTEDLNELTAKIPVTHSHIHPELFEMLPLHLKRVLPDANISLINDTDVHNGNIFRVNYDGIRTNTFDLLMIGHQEYVTLQEYSNFKTFVSNGGTLVVLTGNIFYAEVRYDADSNSVTLVRGHGWIFNGKSAWRDLEERWEEETREWLGSNSYPNYYGDRTYHKLGNNPFDFIGNGGGEEQYYDKSNTKIQIILDYESSDPRYPIASYELDYGKGRVIVTGLPSEDIISDPCSRSCQRFVKFFDNLLSNNAAVTDIAPGYKCRNCNTINKIILEDGELKTQV